METYACRNCGCAVGEDDYILGNNCPMCSNSLRSSISNISKLSVKPRKSEEFEYKYNKALAEIDKN